ncbi:hypothetical protein ES708_30424 [subsurface metagenome]
MMYCLSMGTDNRYPVRIKGCILKKFLCRFCKKLSKAHIKQGQSMQCTGSVIKELENPISYAPRDWIGNSFNQMNICTRIADINLNRCGINRINRGAGHYSNCQVAFFIHISIIYRWRFRKAKKM